MHHSHDRGDYHTVICIWLTGTSPILVLLQGPDGSIYCHDVYRGRLYLVAHSVSLFARLGLRHCEPLYAAPRWKHVPLPNMWVASPPASATLTQTLAVSATHGLDALYSLLKIHRGTPCSLIHPVNGYVLDMILTGRSFQEAPCQNTRTSVKTTPHGRSLRWPRVMAVHRLPSKDAAHSPGGDPNMSGHRHRCPTKLSVARGGRRAAIPGHR